MAAVVLLAGCTGGSTSADSSAASSQPGVFSSEAPSAFANVTLQGDAALTGAFNQPDVRCGFPDVTGPSIALLSTPEGFVFRISVQQDKVTVLVSDDATPPNERDFTGTGVSRFDAGRGATVDSPLIEATGTASSPGTIGALTAIKASIDCASQDPGTSTITFTGDTALGPVTSAQPQTVRVECNLPGNEVDLVGILTIAGQPTFLDVGLRPDALDIGKTAEQSEIHYISAPGIVTLNENGATVNGDAVEQGGATPPHVLHVEGDAVCGTPVGTG